MVAAQFTGSTSGFQVEHRLRTKDGDWKWILNWGRVPRTDRVQPRAAPGGRQRAAFNGAEAIELYASARRTDAPFAR